MTKMYRVWRVFRDNEGNIYHKRPIGCSRTLRGARALGVGGCGIGGEIMIEELEQ